MQTADHGKSITHTQQQLVDLMSSIDRYRIAAENSNEILLDYNLEDDSIVHLTSRVSNLFGLPSKIEHAPDYLLHHGIIQPESAQDFKDMIRRLHDGEPQADCIIRARTVHGDLLWMQIVLTVFPNEGGVFGHATGVLRDITAQREAELQSADATLRRNILMRESLIYYEADLTTRKMLFGVDFLLQSIKSVDMNNFDEAFDFLIKNVVYPDERDYVRSALSADSLLARFEKGEDQLEIEYRRLTGSGSVTWVKGRAYLVRHPITHHVIFYYYVTDINDVKLRGTNLRDRTERDPLTGLYNKIAAELRIQKAIESGAPEGKTGALLIVALNQFEQISEQMGHYFADAFLSELGYRLQEICSENDIIGRGNGTEFILYLQNLSGRDEAEKRILAMYEAFCENRVESLEACELSVSAGASLFPSDGNSFNMLYRCADLALHESGSAGGVCMYRQGMKKFSFHPEGKAAPGRGLEKTFADNTIEYIFHILYDSKDLDAAIVGVLELIAKHYGFSRAYFYEMMPEGFVQCVFQWNQPGLPPIRDEDCLFGDERLCSLQKSNRADNMYILQREDIPSGEFISDDFNARLVYVFRGAEKLQGLVGFDLCGDADTDFLYTNRGELQSIMQVLDVFQASRAASNELWESTFLLQSIVDGFHSCTYIIDPETYLLKYVNQNTRQVISEARPNTRCFETIRGRTEPCGDCPIARMRRNGTTEDRCEMYLDRYNVWARINATMMEVPSGKKFGVFNGFDFSDHQRGNETESQGLEAFVRDTSLYDALALSTDDYIFMCDMSTQLFYFPQKMTKEFSLPGQIVEDAVSVWSERVHPEDRQAFLDEMEQVFSGRSDTHNMEYRVLNKDGIWVWVRARGHIERNISGAPTMFVGILTNLGAKKSKIDHLTGLQDKYEFEVRTRSQLADTPARGSLLILGLDNFKYINNIYGWDFGDSVLKESVQRLTAMLPEKLELYRLDGDKFGVFFAGMEHAAVEEYYQSLCHVFRQHRQLGEHRYFCTISGGCAFFEGETPSFDVLFKQASRALEYSKREGKTRLTFYDEERMGNDDRILTLLAQLHESVESNFEHFELYFQPQVRPKSFEIESAEALLRWKCPGIGPVSPIEFIPLLEQSGLIGKVGQWVLEQSAAVCAEWRKVCPIFTISVNLSFAQLQDQSFLPYLEDNIDAGHIDPSMLHLEITESCIADGSNSLASAFNIMRKMGFRMEMDDFGTGYSSLEILKNAPADVVKIDHAFVQDITRSNFDATFIRFVVALCHSVNIHVCLEGVETWDEYYLVEPMGLDLIQGFLFGRPQPKDEFEKHFLKSSDHFALEPSTLSADETKA